MEHVQVAVRHVVAGAMVVAIIVVMVDVEVPQGCRSSEGVK